MSALTSPTYDREAVGTLFIGLAFAILLMDTVVAALNITIFWDYSVRQLGANYPSACGMPSIQSDKRFPNHEVVLLGTKSLSNTMTARRNLAALYYISTIWKIAGFMTVAFASEADHDIPGFGCPFKGSLCRIPPVIHLSLTSIADIVITASLCFNLDHGIALFRQ
ncbi:hypothetical protein WOLCODRAFT_19679 [Wolfiporia cocos MD-104 SS10]|uniref:Uncharacterized protein n=1 Tax=Wolfiporia cocos (strain MD-104) TaxID=742152 RepID=A0A2H3JBB5_WOLCO|nr:hypothetical protein WOLCODRAFT_19679 [Wolfiporia cocos MD-104 SS10]